MKPISLAILVALLLVPGTAQAEPPDSPTVTINAGTTHNWAGTATNGVHVMYWGDPATGGNATPCGDTAQDYCETLLFEFSNPLTQAEIDAGKKSKTKSATITINNFGPVPDPITDFDLVTFSSDAQGTRGDNIGQSADFGPNQAGDESVSLSITTTPTQPSQFVLVEVVYFAVVGNSGYSGSARF